MTAINEYAKDKKNITVIGGGILGIEAAWSFMQGGKNVTLLEFGSRLMSRQLSEKASHIVEEELKKSGVDVRTCKSIKNIIGDRFVEGIELESGEIISTDILFFSVGVRPNVRLAKEARLTIDKGVVVDNNMKTSDENIYAVGDCAQIGTVIPGIWPLALQTGRIAAQGVCGKNAPMEINPPIVILKALKIGVYAAGDINFADEVIEIDQESQYMYFAFNKGKLVGVNLLKNTALSSKMPKLIMNHVTKREVEQLLEEIGC